MSGIGLGNAALFLCVGVTTGAVYFALLYRTTLLLIARASLTLSVFFYAVRIAGAFLVFWIAAQHGAPAVLVCMSGFLIARYAAQRIAER